VNTILEYIGQLTRTDDSHIRKLIREALQKIMDSALEMPKNVQQNNAQNAVLFEAINLVIHLDTEQDLMVQISQRLGKFIASRETNVRYLGLEAMTHLAARSETLDPIKKHQAIIIGSLRDRDISVRRQGLDLLYSMCDPSNAQAIVNELLRYLQSADYAIREEMVLKIAILTEKYATDVQWYVDISLRLIAMAGDHVSDEVWQRVIQIVTNNEELQVYAAQTILQYIKADCHETLVKIGGYLLGEFGHLIADSKGCSPIEQFMAQAAQERSCCHLMSSSSICSPRLSPSFCRPSAHTAIRSTPSSSKGHASTLHSLQCQPMTCYEQYATKCHHIQSEPQRYFRDYTKSMPRLAISELG
jgi:AP-2 complex subunit alpha